MDGCESRHSHPGTSDHSSATLIGRACLFAGGGATLLMGTYHLVLPSHMQWADAMQDVPRMVTWGLFAINFDLSVMMVLLGALTVVLSLSHGDRQPVRVLSAMVPAVFWTLHALYLRVEPLPIPSSLITLRIVLESYTVAVVGLHWIGVTTLLRQAGSLNVASRWRVAGLGTAGATLVMGSVVLAIFLSMSRIKPSANSGPAMQVPSNDVPTVPVNQILADALNLQPLSALTNNAAVVRVAQGTNLPESAYVQRWPMLADYFRGNEADVDELLRSRDDPGALNLLSQRQRVAEDLEAARSSIDRAIAAEPDEPLHRLQSGYCYLAQMSSEESPMGRWGLSIKLHKEFDLALAGDASLADARYYLAFAFERTPIGYGGDRERSMQLLDEAIDDGDQRFAAVRALFHFERDDKLAGLDDTLSAIQNGFYHDRILQQAVPAALQRDRHDDAMNVATFATYTQPGSAAAWTLLAEVFTAMNEPDRAQRVMQHVRSLQSDSAPISGSVKETEAIAD